MKNKKFMLKAVILLINVLICIVLIISFFNLSNDSSDELFEDLWAKLTKVKYKEEGQESLAGEIRFLRHKLSNIITFMKLKLNTAKRHEDIKPLLEFQKFNMDDLLKQYMMIEHELVKWEIKETRDVRIMIEEIIVFIDDIRSPEVFIDHALNLGSQCLNRAESIYQIFVELKEVIHG